ncbi:hypothetical protein CFHF_08100 [Caulobacter flavus]|uniref:Uncharacterized protein n=1 Tax=Caulobacter flavus TaxID=1679497 RepID=A0A2N5CVD8_9CAUL|nr:hypothetical protein [Caulobacter flavus]AYV46870.1 hypothetical protein C1707_11685 [Caulobacter flavus]PLR17778.1 hypothetical protein CFHF_08100 [Caulobacter flavus]
MAVWTIEIVNAGGKVRSYALLPAPPDVTLDGASVAVWPAVCAPFDYVEPNAPRAATFSEAVQALFAFPAKVEVERVIKAAFTAPVNPLARDLVTITHMDHEGPSRGFAEKLTAGAAEPGHFAIDTKADFPEGDGVVLGLTKQIDSNEPVPAAVFDARPHVTYQIRPRPVFHLIEGRFVRGKVLDLSTRPGAIIDFTGRERAKATVVQAADGGFSVTYEAI